MFVALVVLGLMVVVMAAPAYARGKGNPHPQPVVYVTAEVTGTQHYGVWVRNMFQEERVGGPGILRLSGASA